VRSTLRCGGTGAETHLFTNIDVMVFGISIAFPAYFRPNPIALYDLGHKGRRYLTDNLNGLIPVLRFSFSFFVEWRTMHFPKDPHKFIFSLGFAIVLCVELYKFIRFIAK
jgi:hypothetical protein